MSTVLCPPQHVKHFTSNTKKPGQAMKLTVNCARQECCTILACILEHTCPMTYHPMPQIQVCWFWHFINLLNYLLTYLTKLCNSVPNQFHTKLTATVVHSKKFFPNCEDKVMETLTVQWWREFRWLHRTSTVQQRQAWSTPWHHTYALQTSAIHTQHTHMIQWHETIHMLCKRLRYANIQNTASR